MLSVDLFAGCGGLTRGLEWAGFKCIAFNELNEDAAESFSHNFPDALGLIGDISVAASNKIIREKILPLANGNRIDLVCGGPPCQGYSRIGHRRTHEVEKTEIPSNHLFHEMIRVIKQIQPKAFLFENVEGILSGKWTKRGDKGEIFRDVWAAFASIKGYVVQPVLLHAWGFGVPQNRPRVMIMGIRNEIVVKNGLKAKSFDPTLPQKTFSNQLVKNRGGFFPDYDGSTAPDLIDVLSDLDTNHWNPTTQKHRKKPRSEYQKLMRRGLSGDYKNQRLTDHEFSKHKPHVVERFQYMLDNNVTRKSELPERMRTKKFNQKPVPARWSGLPSITVTSLPDDYVHYSNPRTFSVREWARIQSFPDHHQFCGVRTTGGERRAGNPSLGIFDRDLPKYTQIGNAVPPLLAKELGTKISHNLSAAIPSGC